jgi:hypothetical protein
MVDVMLMQVLMKAVPDKADRIIELVKTRSPRRFGLDPIRDIQVLCPMNRGGVRARSPNIELQAALNPAGDNRWSGSAGPLRSATKSCRSTTTTIRRSTTATSGISTTSTPMRARPLRALTVGPSFIRIWRSRHVGPVYAPLRRGVLRGMR